MGHETGGMQLLYEEEIGYFFQLVVLSLTVKEVCEKPVRAEREATTNEKTWYTFIWFLEALCRVSRSRTLERGRTLKQSRVTGEFTKI